MLVSLNKKEWSTQRMSEVENIELVIFDCDGTLVESEDILARVYSLMSEQTNTSITYEDALITFKGRKVLECLSKLFSTTSEPKLNSLYEEFRHLTRKEYGKGVEAVSGIENLIKKINVPYCVASSSPRIDIELLLKHSGLSTYFKNEHIFSSYEIDSWKPEPEIFLTAAKFFNVNSKNCLVIEDSDVGVKAALSAKMSVMHYFPYKNKGKNQFNSMLDLMELF
jgi:HAD superfamily hydrolase (TIGR01509 family)